MKGQKTEDGIKEWQSGRGKTLKGRQDKKYTGDIIQVDERDKTKTLQVI